MTRRWMLLLLGLAVGTAGCVKRFPAAAGADRTLEAGQEMTFGRPVEDLGETEVVWTMGDGTRLRGARVAHAWQLPGSYQVRVEITDPDGSKRSDTARIQVTRPALLQVVPQDAAAMILCDRPAERLGRIPLLLERLFASGQEANAVLGTIGKALGFDPFTPEGLRGAGLDPQGGVAWVILDPAGKTNAVVAAVSDAGRATRTIERLFSRSGPVSTRQAEANPRITELLREGERPVAAMTIHRGYLWLAVPTGEADRAVTVLAALRDAPPQAGLAAAPGYRRARAGEERIGAVHLYLAKTFLARSQPAAPARVDDELQRIQDQVAGVVDYLRADLYIDDDGLRGHVRLGLSGDKVPVVARAMRARNPVPDFATFIAPDQHLVVKLSADLAGVWRSILELGGQPQLWAQMLQALEQMGAAAGVDLRQGVLDNLGDSYLLALRLKPAAVLEMVASQGRRVPGPARLMDAVLYAQVRDADRLIECLGGLAGTSPMAAQLRPVRGRDNQWTLGAGASPLTLVVDRGFAVLATTAGLARDAIGRMASPREPLPDWPSAMRSQSHQVAWADVGGLVRDLTRQPAPGASGSASFARAMLAMTLGKFASLRHVTLRAALEEQVFTLRLRLTLR